MGSTSKKHRNFILEPIGSKPITAIAGIGPVYGKKLEEAGYDKAYVLLGHFLVLKKSKEKFVNWMNITAGVSNHYAEQTHKCLDEWCNSFL
ncbi:Barrier-to-autointegration factor-like protein [Orchesella cincta]|uniref:Barrier-to-autointegration factor 1 n=1 Tax=Orchesella cincta TaxID=48709 RepID=A0A1D2N177_ORCCI|nr:Barrier-to-autointegration factor-like protein [Orchesella cincta]